MAGQLQEAPQLALAHCRPYWSRRPMKFSRTLYETLNLPRPSRPCTADIMALFTHKNGKLFY